MNNFLESQDPMSKGAGYYNPLLTEAQDATALEMASYNNQPMSKEDFSILSTSQDGIINTLNVLSDEISKHTSIIINKINEVRLFKNPSSNCILLTVKLCLAILRAIYIFSVLVRKVKTFGNLIS